MNELSQQLLETAWQDLKPKERTAAKLKNEAIRDWYMWRNYHVDQWARQVRPLIKRPATDFYGDTPLGEACLNWIDAYGYQGWEIPAYDGEDDDFVLDFMAHWLAVLAWYAFEPYEGREADPAGLWPGFDATPEEIEAFFNFKMSYAPRPQPQKDKKKRAGARLSMF